MLMGVGYFGYQWKSTRTDKEKKEKLMEAADLLIHKKYSYGQGNCLITGREIKTLGELYKCGHKFEYKAYI